MSSDPTANMDNQFATDMTNTVRKTEYASISPDRPELSQAGRTVLITGAGAGIGYLIAQNFIRASAATVILVGRRPEVLAQARIDLQKKAKQLEKPAIVLSEVCDVARRDAVTALWERLGEQNISVDVLVLNAAKVSESVPLLDVGVEELAAAFRANVFGPYHLAQRLYQQPTKGPKVGPERLSALKRKATNTKKVNRLFVHPRHQHILPLPCNYGGLYPGVRPREERRHARVLAHSKGRISR